MNQLNIPIKLFKYRPFEGIQKTGNYGAKTLLNFELYANSRKNFNDPFDLAMPYRISKESLEEENFIKYYINTHPNKHNHAIGDLISKAKERRNCFINDPEKIWEENQSKIEELDNDFYGILCFSESPNEILMWSHYCQFHTGYCLGFNGKKLFEYIFKKHLQYGCTFGPVIYQDEYPEYDLFEGYKKKGITRGFTKHSSWEYEKEYRFQLPASANSIIKYPSEIIDEIYLGCKMPEEIIDYILRFVKIRKMRVKVFKMKMSYNFFGLEPILIYNN